MAKLIKESVNENVELLRGSSEAYKHIYVVGDIHGMYDKLLSVMSQFTVNEDDLLVFLGDYIDRGPDAARCVDYVKNLCAAPNVVALLGNHEMMLLEAMGVYGMALFEADFKKSGYDMWLDNGGMATLKSFRKYEDMGFDRMSLIKWLVNRSYLLRLDDNMYFSHAGFNARKELKDSEMNDFLWMRGDFFDVYKGEDKWFVGHTPVQHLRLAGYDSGFDAYSDNAEHEMQAPLLKGNIAFLDTGSFMGNGCITCMEIKSGEIFQSK